MASVSVTIGKHVYEAYDCFLDTDDYLAQYNYNYITQNARVSFLGWGSDIMKSELQEACSYIVAVWRLKETPSINTLIHNQ